MKKRSFPIVVPDHSSGGEGSFYRKYIAPWEWLIFAVLLTGLAIALRAFLFGFQSNDYTNFLKPWYDKIKAGGGYRALGSELGSDYTPFYLFFLATLTYLPVSPLTGIKLFSCLFDFVTAAYVALIVYRMTSQKRLSVCAYAVVLFLPNVFLDGAEWGQCDMIYICFVVMSVYYAMKDNSYAAAALFGVAFAVKLQAIFFAPVLVLLLCKGKLKWRSVPLILVSYLLVGLPAVICGMAPYAAYLRPYLTQMGEYENLYYAAPNLYCIVKTIYYTEAGQVNEGHLRMLGKAFTLFGLGATGIAMIFFHRKKFPVNEKNLISTAYFFALFVPFVLPYMHERYFLLSDIFAVLFVFSYPKKSYIGVATMYASLRAIAQNPFHSDFDNKLYMGLVVLAAIVCLAGVLKKEIFLRETPQTPRSLPLSGSENE